MNFAERAFAELFPDKIMPRITLYYSGKFSLYNANVRRSADCFEFGLSKSWRGINNEIKTGLIQSLLLRIYRQKKHTMNIDLYENFTKNIHISIRKTKSEPELEASFGRINEKYFNGLIEKTNLKWGSASTKTLGVYNYHNDTITISRIFKEAPKIFTDYVMYHEMLHKKMKFQRQGNVNVHHTRKFKEIEKEFENHLVVEKELKDFLKSMPRRKRWWFI
jgi:predicted metal-dependent hydrolase